MGPFHYFTQEGTSPWYSRSAELGDDVAQYNLGFNLMQGRGCAQDPELAELWFRRSAEQGNCMALNALARLREEACQLPEAKALYERAASFGSATAMMNLARVAARGAGGAGLDEVAMVRWLRAALEEEEDGEALCSLGKAHAQGRGVPTDLAAAQGLFRQAAELGYPEAQFCYGLACEQGWGGQPVPAEALLWYGRAAGQGSAKALEGLARVRAAAS